MPESRTIDGNLKLKEQELTLRLAEQAGPYSVKTYRKAAGSAKKNRADLVDVPLGQDIPDLEMVEVAIGTPNAAAAAMRPGKTLAFNDLVFVEGQETQVAGFR